MDPFDLTAIQALALWAGVMFLLVVVLVLLLGDRVEEEERQREAHPSHVRRLPRPYDWERES